MPRNPFIDDRAEDDSEDEDDDGPLHYDDRLDDDDEISLGGDEDEDFEGDGNDGIYTYRLLSKFSYNC